MVARFHFVVRDFLEVMDCWLRVDQDIQHSVCPLVSGRLGHL